MRALVLESVLFGMSVLLLVGVAIWGVQILLT